MLRNPPDGYQRIIPDLAYEDCPAALRSHRAVDLVVHRWIFATPLDSDRAPGRERGTP
jgi:hypothetical protein